MTKIHNIEIEEIVPCLLLTSKEETWELALLILKEKNSSFKTGVYLCYHQKLLQWAETTKGLALTKFMDLIPNVFRDKIPTINRG